MAEYADPGLREATIEHCPYEHHRPRRHEVRFTRDDGQLFVVCMTDEELAKFKRDIAAYPETGGHHG